MRAVPAVAPELQRVGQLVGQAAHGVAAQVGAVVGVARHDRDQQGAARGVAAQQPRPHRGMELLAGAVHQAYALGEDGGRREEAVAPGLVPEPDGLVEARRQIHLAAHGLGHGQGDGAPRPARHAAVVQGRGEFERQVKQVRVVGR